MKDEIKEILDKIPLNVLEALGNLENGALNYYKLPKIIEVSKNIILDYITNLETIEQQYSAILSENTELEIKITNLEQENKEQLDENYKLSEWLVKKQKRIEELEKENKHLNDLLDNSNNECEKLRNKQDKAIKTLKDTSVDMPSTLLIETIDYARHQLLGGDE